MKRLSVGAASKVRMWTQVRVYDKANMKQYSQPRSGTLIRVLTVPGQADLGEFALDIARRSLVYYESYFDVPGSKPERD